MAQQVVHIADGLEKIGFENIRTLKFSNEYYIALENTVFRWEPAAIVAALDYITEVVGENAEINLVFTENGIPQKVVSINSDSWGDLLKNPGSKNTNDWLVVTGNTGEAWTRLKNQAVTNPSFTKVDFVIFPQFAYENTRLAKLYEFQFNAAPTMNFSLWKGNKFTGQVIFPLHNELGYEGNFIRPGYITVSQDFRPFEKWWGTLALGNFSSNRYGIDLTFKHLFKNENWLLELNAGCTGTSHFYDNKWLHGPLNTITGLAAISWYNEKFDMVFRGGILQYIYKDKGLMASVTRYFGEVAVGFYAQVNEHNYNAGVNMTIPLPVRKRKSRNQFNVTIPEHLEFSYNAGTELFYGQYFRSNPMINQIKNIKFTLLTKKNVLNLIK